MSGLGVLVDMMIRLKHSRIAGAEEVKQYIELYSLCNALICA